MGLPRQQLSLDDDLSLAIRGGFALAARQVVVQAANILGSVALARLLSVAEFGLWSVASFAFNVCVSLTGLGLGTSLIRQPREPTAEDEWSIFAAQQALTLSIVTAAWLLVPRIASDGRDFGAAWMVPLLGAALLASSFQTIPSARLERRLQFDRLALVEVGQSLTYNAAAATLAARGFGISGLAWALLARSMVGAALAHLACPWRIGWAWNRERLVGHVRFGLPYQGGLLLSTVKDSITPVFVGLTAGAAAVGTVSWAQTLATFPVVVLMILQRVYLPVFARAQESRAALGSLVETVVGSANALVAPVAVLVLILRVPLVREVFGAQWLAAVPLFMLLWPANLFVATVTPLLALLNALGRSPVAFGYALVWAVGTWAIGGPLILLLGPIGYGWANLLIQLTNIALIRQVQAIVPFRLWLAVGPPWLWAGVMGAGVAGVARRWPPEGIVALGLYAGSGLLVYVAGLALLLPEGAQRAWERLRKAAA